MVRRSQPHPNLHCLPSFVFGRSPSWQLDNQVNNRNTRTRVWNIFKVNDKDTKTTPLALTIKTPKRLHWRRFGVFIVNFEHISHFCSSVSIVNFEQVNAGWTITYWRHLAKVIDKKAIVGENYIWHYLVLLQMFAVLLLIKVGFA